VANQAALFKSRNALPDQQFRSEATAIPNLLKFPKYRTRFTVEQGTRNPRNEQSVRENISFKVYYWVLFIQAQNLFLY
jgi:hypothetical protein